MYVLSGGCPTGRNTLLITQMGQVFLTPHGPPGSIYQSTS